MKNLKFRFALLGFILLTCFFLPSCSNDPSVELPVSGKKMLLAEFKSDNDVTRFEYNPDSSLNKIFFTEDPISSNQNVTYTVKYLPNKKVDELIGSNNTRIKVTYSNISYGFNGIIKTEIFTGTNLVSETDYSYSNDKIPTALISLISPNPVRGIPTFKYVFTHNSANNIAKMRLFYYNQLSSQFQEESIVNFQFDDKKNPFEAAGDLMLIFWQYSNKNNIILQENKDINGDLLELIESTYTYNGLNYPTKATVRITEPSMAPVTSQLVFTYK